MSKDTMAEEIKKAEARIAEVEKEIETLGSDIQATGARLEMARDRKAVLESELKQCREERQKALAMGQSSQKINKRISEIREEMEEGEDEVIGLEAHLRDLNEKMEQLQGVLNEVQPEPSRIKLRHLAGRYNKLASEMAPVVEEMWRLRLVLEPKDYDSTIVVPLGWHWGTALTRIPKIFFPDEDIPEHRDFANNTYFDFFNVYQPGLREETKNV
jgi:chromosome segregation ATPase